MTPRRFNRFFTAHAVITEKTVEISISFCRTASQSRFSFRFRECRKSEWSSAVCSGCGSAYRQNNASRSELSRFSTLNWRIALKPFSNTLLPQRRCLSSSLNIKFIIPCLFAPVKSLFPNFRAIKYNRLYFSHIVIHRVRVRVIFGRSG